MIVVVALAWGTAAGVAAAAAERRARCHRRLGTLVPRRSARRLRLPEVRLPLPGRRRAAEARTRADLVIATELLRVGVTGGLTPRLALEASLPFLPPRAARRFEAILRACELGVPLRSALMEAAAEETTLRPLAAALASSDRLGVAVADSLGRLASDERAALRRDAEARARTVPVRLLFPLVFLVLPAFLLLGIVPSILAGAPG